VLNVLLQLLDEGRLTDGRGHTVVFRNTIVILTSHQSAETLAPDGETALPAELLNRVDEILSFDPLQPEHLRVIVAMEVERVRDRLRERGITLTWSEAASDALAGQADAAVHGARLVRRVVQHELTDPIALGLLTGEYRDADEIAVDAGDGALRFERRRPSVIPAPRA
jgi:ATP-dependent Clp protease ATP-binding subunit ClpB